MKYLVFSDLHGSFPMIEKLIVIFNEKKCDKIICLGDMLYHGPRNDLPDGYNPKKVIQELKEYRDKIIWIQGNCDAEVDEMVLGLKYVKKKKITINNKNIILTHGHHLSKYDIDEKLNENDVVIYGHYHVFDITIINNVTYINIGSPSIPKDGISQYAIIDNENMNIYNFNGDIIGEYNF